MEHSTANGKTVCFTDPLAPENFLASPSTKSSLRLSWTQSGVVTDYVLQVSLEAEEQSGFNFTFAKVSETEYAGYVTGLGKSGATYTLVLTAVSGSAASSGVSAMATTCKYGKLWLPVVNVL